ncbi:hypothetical protein FHS43_000843 [Streptosporangium becharense]|uniref:AMIN-like domain-containing protein n=1 Tax=Streptosporangium becharense TaxID=1816182 RepID=A0A7W9MFV1_9ACTN|nr:hypothetical protein [Streptosporangium becharense]MBB2909597.1 hypothetical protein [Streptosporangium becharense]MBB5819447.1 hypothetical protein [Streptosporangium becharense]
MNRTLVPLALLPLVLLSGCGSSAQTAAPSPGGPATTAAPPPSDTPAPPPSTTPAAGLEPPTGTGEIEVTHTVDTPPTVTGARFAQHRGFDRVVIDLRGDVPAYSVRWVPELVQDGSGERIDVQGGAYLQVTMNPATAHTEAGESTWAGGPVFRAGLGNVQSVVRTGDFEAVVGVGVVLDRKAAFRVLEQKNPSRLIIDVAHGKR